MEDENSFIVKFKKYINSFISRLEVKINKTSIRIERDERKRKILEYSYGLKSKYYTREELSYLLDITSQRFLKSVNKYYQVTQEEVQSTSHVSDVIQSDEAFIYVKENKRVIKVLLNDILYVEGLSEYVQIYTGKKKIITKTSIINLENKLPNDGFLRIHKSFIVSMSRIEAFTAHTIEIPGKKLHIGRSYKNLVLNALQLNGSVAQ